MNIYLLKKTYTCKKTGKYHGNSIQFAFEGISEYHLTIKKQCHSECLFLVENGRSE